MANHGMQGGGVLEIKFPSTLTLTLLRACRWIDGGVLAFVWLLWVDRFNESVGGERVGDSGGWGGRTL